MFTTGLTYQKTITMVTESCITCGVVFGFPSDLKEVLQNDPSKSFYCPNGHSMVYRKSKEQRLREEVERKLREKENELMNVIATKIQLEDKLTKSNRDLKRLKNGVCPCCNRSFKGLHEHIKKQHPQYKI